LTALVADHQMRQRDEHLRHNKRLNRFNLRGKGFNLRGKDKVNAQWHLYCMVHNIEKLAHSGWLG